MRQSNCYLSKHYLVFFLIYILKQIFLVLLTLIILYINFRVTDPEYKIVQSKISTIWRRYTEFEQIHDYMQVTYPHVVIPPLPEKRVSKTKDFLNLKNKLHSFSLSTQFQL